MDDEDLLSTTMGQQQLQQQPSSSDKSIHSTLQQRQQQQRSEMAIDTSQLWGQQQQQQQEQPLSSDKSITSTLQQRQQQQRSEMAIDTSQLWGQQQQQQQEQPLSSDKSITSTLQQRQQQQRSEMTIDTSQYLLSPHTPVTPTTPRTTTHTPREIPTMYILDDLYDDDYIDQFNSYNTTTIPTEEPDTTASVQLAPCPICSRTFNPATLRKHVGICEKMATKRRKVFDSSRQRREGTELAAYPLPKGFGLPEKPSNTSLAKTKSERGHSPNPQQVSSPVMQRKKPIKEKELVRSTARSSMRKLSTSSVDAVTPTNFNRDRMRSSDRSLTRRAGVQSSSSEQCPHCDRCFGVKAYDRHVEWCKEKALQASIKLTTNNKVEDNVAKARLEARTKYRAPCLKTKRSVNRDKYSGFPGDENEESPKSQKIGNRAHDGSLMSMSMTSSITSERKTEKTTGNRISEATTISSPHTSQPLRQQTPPPPPLILTLSQEQETTSTSITTTTSTTTATTTAPAPAATSNTLNRKRSRNTTTTLPSTQLVSDDLSTDTVANLEIEMPDLRRLGEQISTTRGGGGDNKKIKATMLKAKEKTNPSIGGRKATTTTKQNQQHNLLLSRSDHKLQNASSMINPKKTISDSCLKTKRQTICKDSKVSQGGGAVAGIITPGPDDEEHVSPRRKADFTKSLTFYASLGHSNDDIAPMQSDDEEPVKPTKAKMTMEEYFNSNTTKSNEMEVESLPRNSLKKSETIESDISENFIVGSKKIMSTRKNFKKVSSVSKIQSKEMKKDEAMEEKFNIRDVILKRCEVLGGSSMSSSDPAYARMTMAQTYIRNRNEEDISEEDHDDDDDDMSVKDRKSSARLSKTKEYMSQITKMNAMKSLLDEKTRLINARLDPNEGNEMHLPRHSSHLSADESYTFASKPKKVLANVSKETLEYLGLSASDLEEFNSLDENERLALRRSLSSRYGTGKKRDHSPAGATNEPNSSVKKSSSNTENFRKSDTESEENFVTAPARTPDLSYEDLQTVIPNCRTYSPQKRQASNVSSPSKEKNSALKNSSSQEQLSPKQSSSKQSSPNQSPTKQSTPLRQKIQAVETRSFTPRLQRCSTPPPVLIATNSLPTTPRTPALSRFQLMQPKLQTSPIKSLSIYRPQRTKIQRQTVSCLGNSSVPMKAIPLSKESIEIFGVSAASHISQDITKQQATEAHDDYVYFEDEKMTMKQQSEEEEDEEEDEEEELSEKCESENVKKNEKPNALAGAEDDEELQVIKKPPSKTKLERNNSFTISGLPDNYDPFLSAKRQLEELCSPTDSPSAASVPTPQTPQLPLLPSTPAESNRMSTSLTLGSVASHNTSSPMTTSQTPHQTIATPKTPTLARSSSFRRTGSLRGPRRSPLLTQRIPLFAQKHRPTIQRGLSDEGPISSNFLKPEEFDEMPVRSVCVNDYALTKSPRVVRRDTSASNRKQPLKLNINVANSSNSNGGLTPDAAAETESAPHTASRYISKTDSLAAFLKYETELEKLNKAASQMESKNETIDENANPTLSGVGKERAATIETTLHGPLNAKELKDKSNNLSKQNSAKNIKAEFSDSPNLNETNENFDSMQQANSNNTSSSNTVTSANTNDLLMQNKYNSVRLTPLSKPTTPLVIPTTHLSKPTTPVTVKPSTPFTKPTTPLTTKPSTPFTKPTTPLTMRPSTPLTKPSTPMTNKPNTPLSPLNVKTPLVVPLEQMKPQKPVALSSIFSGNNIDETCKNVVLSEKSNEERKTSIVSDYIDPKLINKCDNLPVNLNKLRGSVFKTSDMNTTDPRLDSHHFSSSSSESSAPTMKILPSVKAEMMGTNNYGTQAPHSHSIGGNSSTQTTQNSQTQTQHPSLSQRNSAEGRNLLKRRMRLGRNQFLYDASPEIDSCSADDEANRSSLECERFVKEQEEAFERFKNTSHINMLDETPFIPPPPLPVEFEDFDFEEFLSSFENDEEQFPLFKDCREFLLNRTSKKQRSMLIPNSNVNAAPATVTATTDTAQTKNVMPNDQQQHTFPPLTPPITYSNTQAHYPQQQHSQSFQFPDLPQHKGLFDSFSLSNRSKCRPLDQYPNSLKSEEKREIFISIETEQNDLDKSPMSPSSIRHMVGNPQCVVEVEVDAQAHDNKFSKISDDDEMPDQQMGDMNSPHTANRLAGGGKQFFGFAHLPNVQLNNAKNLIQQMQQDFRHIGEEMSANYHQQSMEHQRAALAAQPGQGAGGDQITISQRSSKAHKATGTPSGDAYADSDELSSLDGYPLSSPSSRLGVSSKASADSAYGSLSRQRSSELTGQRQISSRYRPPASAPASSGNATMMNRPLTEERLRQLSASSTSSSEHALPPISGNCNYQTQQQQQQHQQQQHLSQLYNNNNINSTNTNNNNNKNSNDHLIDDMMHYDHNTNNNNNYDTPIHPSINNGGTTTNLSNMGATSSPMSPQNAYNTSQQHESSSPMSLSNGQLYGSTTSNMSSSMKMSKFCHECGSRFLLEQAKFCMDCGVKRIVL